MFTKYNNINVPKNYGGSRFQPSTNDTEMKTHRAEEIHQSVNKIKTSVSPYFQSTQNSDKNPSFSDDENDFLELNDTETEETINTPVTKIEKSEKVSPLNFSGFKELTKLFKGVNNDDLLLLALILLFATDKGENSLDTLFILAFLLLYH